MHIVVTPHWEFGDLCFPYILVAQGGWRRFEPKTYFTAGSTTELLYSKTNDGFGILFFNEKQIVSSHSLQTADEQHENQ
jgi:hypothetical protein